MRYNPRELKMVTAGADKHAVVWDLEGMRLEAETKSEATGIEALAFDMEGKYLFTASQDSLKVWRADQELKPLSSFSVKWKGIKDLKMSIDNQTLQGLATGPKGFVCWRTDWAKVPASPFTTENEKDGSGRSVDRAPPRHAFSRDNIPGNEVKGVGQGLGESKDPKYNMLETLGEIRKDHKKFSTSLEQKQNYLAPIIHWLTMGNVRAAVNAIEKQNDPMVIIDLINMLVNTKKVDAINIEFATTLLRKAILLAESQFIVHIKTGLSFALICVTRFKQEILTMRSVNIQQVDLAREERVKKYEEFCQELRKLSQSRRLGKIREKYKNDEVGVSTTHALEEINSLLERAGF